VAAVRLVALQVQVVQNDLRQIHELVVIELLECLL
jgi:hypothetical protein